MIEQLFLHRVPVKPGHAARAAGDGGPGPPAGFQVPGEELDVSPAGLEQMELVLLAPAGELPQIQLAGCRVRPLYPARNPANARRSVLVNTGVMGTSAADGIVVAIRHLRDSG